MQIRKKIKLFKPRPINRLLASLIGAYAFTGFLSYAALTSNPAVERKVEDIENTLTSGIAGASNNISEFINGINGSAFGATTKDMQKFASPEEIILRHWKKDFYGFDFERAVNDKVKEMSEIIHYYSGCFSRLTMYDDFVHAAIGNAEHISESLARSAIVAESCADLYARSPKKAIGPAQYIRLTALEDEILINKFVDYRRHPLSITKGIMRLDALADEYNGDIMLALIGYNANKYKWCEGIVNRFGPEYLWQDINKFIPPETEEYILRIFALKRIYENSEDYKLDIEKKPLFSDQIKKEHKVKKKESLYKIAKAYGVPLRKISRVNPQLNNRKIKEGMVLNIPY